ncbi:hypothetical protein [Cohaesibacter celericrescens]|uniref:Uncharacterized protein n=1 Tax=Cohaesibacter celericrescens TaxID=2067669 RepID=A0A2N5XRP1_9HYPH|nr:hypothetical protein [Cohaesibacter celericrescens]PLW77183.1 hypothetical protein C0081_10950 [Cohaesibacter celericrescens]
MAIPHLKPTLFASVFCISAAISCPSFAAMAVIDINGLTEAQKQVAALKAQLDTAKDSLKVVTDQLETLKEVQKTATDTLGAIGELGNISVPSLNFDQLASSIASDKSCLMSNFEDLMPSINTESLSLGSLCDRSTAYKTGLVATKEKMREGSWEEKTAIQKAVKTNRANTISDATFKGLAQADQAQDTASITLETAQDYKQAGKSATDMNGRLQVLVEIGVAQLTTQAQTNQILAQILKVTSASIVSKQVPIENDLAEDADYGSGEASE